MTLWVATGCEALEAYRDAVTDRDSDFLRDTYVEGGRFTWIEQGEVGWRIVEGHTSSPRTP